MNRPNQGGTQIFNQQDNISIRKRDTDRVNNCAGGVISGPSVIPNVEIYGKTNAPSYKQQQQENAISQNRMNPDILDAFKNNPYTQSLTSYA